MFTEFKSWCEEHKKELAIGGCVLGAAVVGVVTWTILKKKTVSATTHITSPQNLIPMLSADEIPLCLPNHNPIEKVSIEEIAPEIEEILVFVPRYQRRLPAGQHPSTKKIEEAMELGIELLDNHTLVDEFKYPKR